MYFPLLLVFQCKACRLIGLYKASVRDSGICLCWVLRYIGHLSSFLLLVELLSLYTGDRGRGGEDLGAFLAKIRM